jgi:hypothetical protein
LIGHYYHPNAVTAAERGRQPALFEGMLMARACVSAVSLLGYDGYFRDYAKDSRTVFKRNTTADMIDSTVIYVPKPFG